MMAIEVKYGGMDLPRAEVQHRESRWVEPCMKEHSPAKRAYMHWCRENLINWSAIRYFRPDHAQGLLHLRPDSDLRVTQNWQEAAALHQQDIDEMHQRLVVPGRKNGAS